MTARPSFAATRTIVASWCRRRREPTLTSCACRERLVRAGLIFLLRLVVCGGAAADSRRRQQRSRMEQVEERRRPVWRRPESNTDSLCGGRHDVVSDVSQVGRTLGAERIARSGGEDVGRLLLARTWAARPQRACPCPSQQLDRGVAWYERRKGTCW